MWACPSCTCALIRKWVFVCLLSPLLLWRSWWISTGRCYNCNLGHTSTITTIRTEAHMLWPLCGWLYICDSFSEDHYFGDHLCSCNGSPLLRIVGCLPCGDFLWVICLVCSCCHLFVCRSHLAAILFTEATVCHQVYLCLFSHIKWETLKDITAV